MVSEALGGRLFLNSLGVGTVTEDVEGDLEGNFNSAGSLNQGGYIRN